VTDICNENSDAFCSILFDNRRDQFFLTEMMPDFFINLNLDQIINAVIAGKEEYDLKSFFYTPVHDTDLIKYRQDIFNDLERGQVFEIIKTFSLRMAVMRRYSRMIEKLTYKYHRGGWFLETVIHYLIAVRDLKNDLSSVEIKSRGLLIFCKYLESYVSSQDFQIMLAEAVRIKEELASIDYCINIDGGEVTVFKFNNEPDYRCEVEKIFERFRQGAVKDHLSEITTAAGMNHIGAAILKRVARLFPDIFSQLLEFNSRHESFADNIITIFDREIQFYVSYIEYINIIKKKGLKFCCPVIVEPHEKIIADECFDLALADKLVKSDSAPVCNDFYINGAERIIVVSGPNQGGKTTFARAFEQLHYIAGLGLPVPARDARIFIFDKIFTHFEQEENINDLSGKLRQDLLRINSILKQSTSKSIIILNEIFTSTTAKDAALLSRKIMNKIVQLDSICIWVTFLDELALFNEKTVSMVSMVSPENPDLRTFKIVRTSPQGLAYAQAIAEKYGLTYHQLKERFPG